MAACVRLLLSFAANKEKEKSSLNTGIREAQR